jgi:hypothetical protein
MTATAIRDRSTKFVDEEQKMAPVAGGTVRLHKQVHEDEDIVVEPVPVDRWVDELRNSNT